MNKKRAPALAMLTFVSSSAEGYCDPQTGLCMLPEPDGKPPIDEKPNTVAENGREAFEGRADGRPKPRQAP